MTRTVRNAAALMILFFTAGFAPLPRPAKLLPVMMPRPGFSVSILADDKAETAATLYSRLNLAGAGLSENAFTLALKGLDYCREKGLAGRQHIITVIDFTKPSTQKRLFVIDIARGKLLLQSLVAHGKNSGEKYASRFSDKKESHQSSLGLYVTLGTYTGKHGYSLRLKGCESGINSNAYNRDIVLHGADYVSESFIAARGFLGRSEGCPAVPEKLTKKIIDHIKGGSCLFIYHPSPDYTKNSKLLNW
jgi:L,D-transpeptidase catalytic domain